MCHSIDIMSHRMFIRGVQYLTKENLKVIRPSFQIKVKCLGLSYLCDTFLSSKKIDICSKYNFFSSVVNETSFWSWDICYWATTIVINVTSYMTWECIIQLRNQNIYSPKFKQQIWHWTCNIKLITVIQLVLNCNKKWFYIESLIWKKNLALA